MVLWLCLCCSMAAASMQASGLLFAMLRGRGVVALVPTWLGGYSWRGRFGDSGVSTCPSIPRRSRRGRWQRRWRDPLPYQFTDSDVSSHIEPVVMLDPSPGPDATETKEKGKKGEGGKGGKGRRWREAGQGARGGDDVTIGW